MLNRPDAIFGERNQGALAAPGFRASPNAKLNRRADPHRCNLATGQPTLEIHICRLAELKAGEIEAPSEQSRIDAEVEGKPEPCSGQARSPHLNSPTVQAL